MLLAPVAHAADEAPPSPRPALPDLSATIVANRSYWIPAGEIVVFDFLLNRFDQAHFGCCDFDVTARTVRRNLRSSWVVDRDPFTVNQLGHPYQGSMYHGFARSRVRRTRFGTSRRNTPPITVPVAKPPTCAQYAMPPAPRA